MNTVYPNKIPENGVNVISFPVKVCVLDPRAEVPYKERFTDIGWDVTLIGRDENRVEDMYGEVNLFTTGISLEPPQGYYFEMMARSSLHKAGYMLATGTSVIDPEYRGELKVPLYKFKEVDDLETPFRGVQLVLREANYAHFITSGSLEKSSRGANGFGSTGGYKKPGMTLNTGQPRNTMVPDFEEYDEKPRKSRRPVSNKNHMF